MTDASGSLVEAYRYNMYGQPLQASTVGNLYMFTGRRFDSETGLYYYRARYYSPQLRRFIEPDPIGFEGGMNLYAYVGNDPGNATDPWGLYRSLEILRYIVPGQILFDHGMTALENGNYGRAAAYFAGMLGEQVLFALSFGESYAAKGASTSVCNINKTESITVASEQFFEGTRYSQKVLDQIAREDFHAFPEIVRNFAREGTVETIRGGDGALYQILRIPGSYKGRNGFFEFIKDAAGEITHRYFNPQ